MDWKDILKNVITQSRVKEIEDIDIDIEDDDCKRWIQGFSNIMKSFTPSHEKHPKIEEKGNFNSVTEEEACALKGLILRETKPTDIGKNPFIDIYEKDNVHVEFEFEEYGNMDITFGYHVYLVVKDKDNILKWETGFALPTLRIIHLENSIYDYESIDEFVDEYIAPMEKMVNRLRKYTNKEYFYKQFRLSMIAAIKKAVYAFVYHMQEQGETMEFDYFNNRDYINIYDKAFK
tara:strand:- start:2007 stop:2705 length:699 start_codon:yes stop_codon:yes gene_type:complete